MDRDYGEAEECGWCGYTFDPLEVAGCPKCNDDPPDWVTREVDDEDEEDESWAWSEGVDPITGDDL